MCSYSSFIYGLNEGVDRRSLWANLGHFANIVGNHPWVLSGDFNVVCKPCEKLGKAPTTCYEQEFNQCIVLMEVLDHPAVECYYTWSYKRYDGVLTAKELDIE